MKLAGLARLGCPARCARLSAPRSALLPLPLLPARWLGERVGARLGSLLSARAGSLPHLPNSPQLAQPRDAQWQGEGAVAGCTRPGPLVA